MLQLVLHISIDIWAPQISDNVNVWNLRHDNPFGDAVTLLI